MKIEEFSKEDYVLASVPKEGRATINRTLIVWLGFCFAPNTVASAIAVASTFSVSQILVIMLVGGIVLGLMSAASGLMGQREGATFSILTRYTFGYRGMIIPAAWVVFCILCWDSICMGVQTDLITQLLNIPQWNALIIIASCLLFTLTTLGGFRRITILGNVAVPLIVIIILIAASRAVGSAGGWSEVMKIMPPHNMSFSAAITCIIGIFALGAGSCSADIQRFCKSQGAAVATGMLAFGIGFFYLIFGIGVAGLASGQNTLSGLFAKTNLVTVGIIAVFLLTWTTIAQDFYGSSLGLSNLFYWKRGTSTIVGGTVVTILALFNVVQHLVGYLVFMGIFATPLAGVMVADYYIVNKGKLPPVALATDKEKVSKVLPSFRVAPFVSWGIGALVVWYLQSRNLGIPPLFGYIVAFGAQILLASLEGKSKLPVQVENLQDSKTIEV